MLRFAFDCMASPCEIALEGKPDALLHEAAQAAIDEVRRIEAKFSRYRADSIVSRINAAAGGIALQVDAETAALFGFAAQMWRTSAGLFDVTSGVLRRAWNFAAARPPARREIEELLPLVGWQHVERTGDSIRLPRAGMEVDFGGFGKEYAADRAAAVLLAHDVRHALVSLGGDIHVVGPRAGSEPWNIAVEHPRMPGASLATLPILRGGIATSGDYERGFEHEGRRYCHVLDARTGWPVDHWQSVSVIAPNTTTAGAAATVAMLKQAAAIEWLDAQEVSYLAVRHDGQVFRREP